MKKLLAASLLLAGIMGVNSQTTSNTTTLTSGGSTSGTLGTKATYYGVSAGKAIVANATASNIAGNTLIGFEAGSTLTTGSNNTFTGVSTGIGACFSCQVGLPIIGNDNSFYGSFSGYSNNGGNSNCFFGANSGSANINGSFNTYLGFNSASINKGSNNVFIGSNSGPVANNQLGAFLSDKLFIDNIRTNTPLIWGDFATDQLKLNGAVGVGAVITYPTNPIYANYKLFVTGGILTDEIRVKLNVGGTWADYVFNKDYNLKPLSEVEKYINENGHLPNVPSAAQVKEEGINIGDMARIQQEKIEELTLYIIAQNKRIEALEAKMNNK